MEDAKKRLDYYKGIKEKAKPRLSVKQIYQIYLKAVDKSKEIEFSDKYGKASDHMHAFITAERVKKRILSYYFKRKMNEINQSIITI